ncbi:hypothetical protein [Fuerstiella marisgermanici]|uniref:Uncharacterized protein n=1 Tax=Fuerstiella marisgermanici TaxID=1891926 RepID=A0A1P8WDN7_9PLAN|nr:hypothetical protein [Fuerstiella marisgermanici]APZ92176.1 hypothetical protein Fuma_01784 [Fuerstiella marisgermanici]
MHTQIQTRFDNDEIRDLACGLNGLLRRLDCSWHDRRKLKFLATAEDRLMPAYAVEELAAAVAAVVETVSTVPVSVTITQRGGSDD